MSTKTRSTGETLTGRLTGRSADLSARRGHTRAHVGPGATFFHRFGVHTFGWDAQFERIIGALLDMGIDGVYSDHVDRLVACVSERSR